MLAEDYVCSGFIACSPAGLHADVASGLPAFAVRCRSFATVLGEE